MNLEQVIRPFQSKDITPAKPIIGKAATRVPVQVLIGDGGDKVFLYATWATTGTETMQPDYREVSRVEKKVKVTNPDDETQYVEVKQIEEVTMRNENAGINPSRTGIGAERIKLRFKNPNP